MNVSSLTGPELSRRVREYAAARSCHVAPQWRAAAFRASAGEPMTLRRARALNAVLTHCELPLWPGELLVGLGNPLRCAPPGTADAAQLKADAEYCAGIGGRHFGTHSDHHAPDYASLLRSGFGGLADHAQGVLARSGDPATQTFLASVLVALSGASAFLRRWARRLELAAAEYPAESGLLKTQAARLAHLAEQPPRDFTDALQLVYSTHTLFQLDERYAMAFGRLDQYLYPFYRADVDAGRLDAAAVQRLLEHFFAKITVDGDVQNIALGGVRPDDGTDATNDLSSLILDACRTIGLPGGNCTARIHPGTPATFLRTCGETIRSGIGYPALFNDAVQIPALVEQGYPLEEARDYCFVGCIEVFIPGRMGPWTDSRFNALQCVNLALFRGINSRTGEREEADTGEPRTWDEFYAAFRTHLQNRLRRHVESLDRPIAAAQTRAAELTSPLLSALTADCIARGRDVNDGGARWPGNAGTAIMGIGVTADALAAVRTFVYERRRFSLDELRALLRADFEGFEKERLELLAGAPKYGNNDDAVDALAVRVVEDAAGELLRHRTPLGGRHWGLLAANVQNISGGREVAASPDGRRSGQPLSDAASPTFGRDLQGPTAAIRSIAKLPYRLCPGGNVVNLKLHPSALAGETGLAAFAGLVRSCFGLGGVQLQFNTTDRRTLEAAMQNPEPYRDLVVRVSGFSAHFTSLDRAVQEDILERSEHHLGGT